MDEWHALTDRQFADMLVYAANEHYSKKLAFFRQSSESLFKERLKKLLATNGVDYRAKYNAKKLYYGRRPIDWYDDHLLSVNVTPRSGTRLALGI